MRSIMRNITHSVARSIMRHTTRAIMRSFARMIDSQHREGIMRSISTASCSIGSQRRAQEKLTAGWQGHWRVCVFCCSSGGGLRFSRPSFLWGSGSLGVLFSSCPTEALPALAASVRVRSAAYEEFRAAYGAGGGGERGDREEGRNKELIYSNKGLVPENPLLGGFNFVC